MTHVNLIRFLWVAAFSLVSPAAQAVIVSGISGTGNNNATQAGLDAYLSSASQTAFPYWNNLVRVGNASGIYLGYDPSTLRGWVLSANHIGAPASITVAGNAYAITGNSARIGSSDLKLYEIGDGLSPALPNLPTVPLAGANASIGDFALMFGRGFTSNTSAPYTWGAPGSDEANGNRWGTNTVEGKHLVNIGTVGNPNEQPYLVVDFDGPTDSGVTAYDAQGASGDSGGGLFINRAGLWELFGIAHFVDDGPDFLELPETGDGVVNPSSHGDFTAYAEVYPYVTSIQLKTGTLIPEPSSAALFGVIGAMLFMRRGSRH